MVNVNASADELNLLNGISTNITTDNFDNLEGLPTNINTKFGEKLDASEISKYSLKEGSSSIVTVGALTRFNRWIIWKY